MANKETVQGIPKRGDIIWTNDCMWDDDYYYHGGKATVLEVEKIGKGDDTHHLIATKEHGRGYKTNWELNLAEKQQELKEKFGDKQATCEPTKKRRWLDGYES